MTWGLLVALAVAYLVACVVWPYAACQARGCKGGKIRSPTGKAWRRCKRCAGKGERVRVGRKVASKARSEWRKGRR